MSSVQAIIKKVLDDYAKAPNVIVNSAGVTRDEFLLKMSPETFQDVINVNLTVSDSDICGFNSRGYK